MELRDEMERVKGIEPSSSAWKAVALPLSYTRFIGLTNEILLLQNKFSEGAALSAGLRHVTRPLLASSYSS